MTQAERLTRRQALRAAAGTVAAGMALATQAPAAPADGDRLKQSLCQWCYKKHWDLEPMCEVAKKLGCRSIELADVKDWPTLQKHGLICALAMSHWFDKGMNNPKYHAMCLEKMRAAIDACAA